MTHGIDRERQIAVTVAGRAEAAEAFLRNAIAALEEGAATAEDRWGHLNQGYGWQTVAVLNKALERAKRIAHDVHMAKQTLDTYVGRLGS